MSAKERARRYYLKNRKKIIARVRAYRAANLGRVRAYDRMRQKRDAFKRRKNWRQWASKNKAHLRRYATTYREKNRAAVRKRQQRWYLEHKAQVIARATERNRKYKKLRKRYCQNYYRRNKDQYRIWVVARRARVKGAPCGDAAAVRAFYKHVRNAPGIRCHWCKKALPKGKRTVDHVVPLKRYGAHDVANLVAACQSCNRRKGAKLPAEFTRAR